MGVPTHSNPCLHREPGLAAVGLSPQTVVPLAACPNHLPCSGPPCCLPQPSARAQDGARHPTDLNPTSRRRRFLSCCCVSGLPFIGLVQQVGPLAFAERSGGGRPQARFTVRRSYMPQTHGYAGLQVLRRISRADPPKHSRSEGPRAPLVSPHTGYPSPQTPNPPPRSSYTGTLSSHPRNTATTSG